MQSGQAPSRRTGTSVIALAIALAVTACQAADGSPSSPGTAGANVPTGDPAGATRPASASPSFSHAVEPTVESASPSTTGSASASQPATPGASLEAATVPPPAPSGVTLDESEGTDATGLVVQRFTVTWSAPLTPGVTIRVYGITRCLNPPTSTGVPCVTDGMKLPASARTVLARAHAVDGTASWSWPLADVDGPVLAWDGKRSYYAFVIAGSNDAGRSPFVVMRSAIACSDCMS